jgi:hypothetical protein
MTHRDTIAEDFARALDLDARRRAVNDAKKRGAAQRCGYDAFHQLVLGANLKPFTKGSWLDHLRDLSSSSSASLSSRTRSPALNFPLSTPAKASVDRSALTAPPRGVDDFSRTWRRFGDDNAAKARFLLDIIPIDAFERIFKAELQIETLRDCIRVLHDECLQHQRCDVGRAAHVLDALTRCGRFEMHCAFIGADVRRDARTVLRLAGREDVAKLFFCSIEDDRNVEF